MMQDRYVGDIGDFGKLGFLRALEIAGLSLGVNWYYTTPSRSEKIQGDGRHLIDQKYFDCDQNLASTLYKLSKSQTSRNLVTLENSHVLQTGIFFRAQVPGKESRVNWHQHALDALQQADLVFLDPDNGLSVKSVSRNSKKAVKYVFDDEIRDYLVRGQSVAFYQHRPHKSEHLYLSEAKSRIDNICNSLKFSIWVLTLPRHSVREIFVISPDERQDRLISKAVLSITNGSWNKYEIIKLQSTQPRT